MSAGRQQGPAAASAALEPGDDGGLDDVEASESSRGSRATLDISLRHVPGVVPVTRDPEVLARQLEAAWSELAELRERLEDHERLRAHLLATEQAAESVRARLVSTESERDQASEQVAALRRQLAAREEAIRELQSPPTLPDDALLEAPTAADLDVLAPGPDVLAVVREQEALEARAAQADQARARAEAAAAEALQERDDAFQRVERLKVALDRVKTAFVRLQEQRASEVAEPEELDGLRHGLDQAREQSAVALQQAAEERRRREVLEAELAEMRGRLATATESGDLPPGIERAGHEGAAQVEDLRRRNAELTVRVQELEEALGESVAAAIEGRKAQKRVGELEARARDLEEALAEARWRERTDGRGQTPLSSEAQERIEELETEVRRLRKLVQRSGAQIQRYLLELEGARSAIARSRTDVRQHTKSINRLHEGIGHLEQALATGGDLHAAGVLLKEIRRRAGELRSLVESNERFGRAMERTIDRLGAILHEG